MTTKISDKIWREQAEKAGLKELAKSLDHNCECEKHKLFHITKEALKYHKQIIHERDKKQKE
jgi:hypothetical protein